MTPSLRAFYESLLPAGGMAAESARRMLATAEKPVPHPRRGFADWSQPRESDE